MCRKPACSAERRTAPGARSQLRWMSARHLHPGTTWSLSRRRDARVSAALSIYLPLKGGGRLLARSDGSRVGVCNNQLDSLLTPTRLASASRPPPFRGRYTELVSALREHAS